MLYKVSRSGYYKWVKRKNQLNRYEKQQCELDFLVKDIHENHPTAGYHTIRGLILQETGWMVSALSVFKSMKRLGIRSCTRKKYIHYRSVGNEHIKHPNILSRRFKSNEPYKKIVTDVTYIKYHGKWYYFACYLDLYNNEILEWELSTVFDNFLVINPAKRLLKKIKHKNVMFHSDQGTQYASIGYCTLLEKNHIIQSMSRAGTPRDNAVIESFFCRFKETLYNDFKLSKNDISEAIKKTVDYFNNKRPVAKLNYKTPVQYKIEQGFRGLDQSPSRKLND